MWLQNKIFPLIILVSNDVDFKVIPVMR